MSVKTTIQIDKETKKMLDELKIHERESYLSVIKRLIKNRIDEEPISQETLKNIEKSLKDIKEGRFYSTKEVKKILGIE